MNALGYDDPPRPVSTIHSVELDGELVLYDTAANRAVHLDPRATLIWQVLDGSVTVGELVEDLAAVFEVDETAIRADVESMLTALHELSFLEPSSPPVRASSELLPDPPSP